MRLLDRYIGASVVFGTSIVMAILVSLFAFTFFIGELGQVGKGSYTVWQATIFVGASLPTLAYQLFPSVALLGSMLGLGMLASNNELLIMRAAGISVTSIAISVMKTGLILMAVATVLGEIVAPQTERYAQSMRAAALSEKITLRTKSGFWVRDGKQFIHIRDLFADGTLGNISIYEFDDGQRLTSIIHANRASYQGSAWVLDNISRTQLAEQSIVTETAEKLTWDSLINPRLVSIVSVSPEFLSAWGLYHYLDYLKRNGLSFARYEQALWKKLFSPLSTGVMVFLAIPFVFGSLRSVAIGQRVLVGALVGIGFYVVNQVTNYVGLVYELPTFLMVTMPPMLFLALAIYMVRRVG